jgi:CBS domain containing-hemolysin-like protein
MLEIQVIVLGILIILSAVFSGTETALMSIDRVKVKSLVRQRKKGSEALQRIKGNPHRLIITILIGNNVVNIGAAALATVIFTDMFGSTGVGIATGVMTFLILVFGEITPKTFANQNAERISLFIARPIEVLSIILSPVVKFFELISRGMSRILGSKKEEKLSEEELKTIVTMGYEEGILDKETADMMHNVLEFEDTTVTEIMTPKVDIEMVEGESSLRDVIDFIVKTPYSRYPVCSGDRDKILGIVDVDDVLAQLKKNNMDVKMKKLTRPIQFVPDSKKIDDMLSDFEGKDPAMAVVVDEYSHVLGLVTVEDILEEIVGEIFDKSKRKSKFIKKITDKIIRVDAKAPIDEIDKLIKIGVDHKQYKTIGGFIERKLQRIPKKGERIRLKNVVIEIDSATKQGIKSVKIIKN